MPTADTTVASLRPNPRNPRKVTDAKLAMLKKAMRRFGDLGGVVLNTTSGHLVGGHQRTKVIPADAKVHITKRHPVATEAGTTAEGHIMWGDERFAYREVAWSEDVEKAANLAANKGAGEFDIPAVAEWIGELDTGDFDMDLTMFDAEELASIMAPVQSSADELVESGGDELDPPADPVTKAGDIYEMGRHRLVCGDCTDAATVAALFSGGRADITFTSPPYNQARNSHLNGRVAGFDNKYQNTADAMSDGDYLQLLNLSTLVALDYTDYVFVNLQLLAHNKRVLVQYQHGLVDKLKDVLVWNKLQCPPNIVRGAFNTKWEYIFCFSGKNETRGFPCNWQGKYPNVVETNSNSSNQHASDHRAGFPIALPGWFFEKLDFVKSVFDPFCGTGTTLLCAEQMGKTCYASELDPGYCDIIVKRWEDHTGQKAKRLPASNGTAKVGQDA